jgi:hypothetical protein
VYCREGADACSMASRPPAQRHRSLFPRLFPRLLHDALFDWLFLVVVVVVAIARTLWGDCMIGL